MRPLPEPPGFPVFGLPEGVGGFRWLMLFQQELSPFEGPITEVSLGHGHPLEGNFVVVTTMHKAPERQVGDRQIGPRDLEFAAFGAVLGMTSRVDAIFATSAPSEQQQAAERILATEELERIEASDSGVILVGWEPVELSVDGVVWPSLRRQLDRAWAVIADLPELVIYLCGPTELRPDRWEVVDVTTRLGDYASDDRWPPAR